MPGRRIQEAPLPHLFSTINNRRSPQNSRSRSRFDSASPSRRSPSCAARSPGERSQTSCAAFQFEHRVEIVPEGVDETARGRLIGRRIRARAVGDRDAEHLQVAIVRDLSVRRWHVAARPALDRAQRVRVEHRRQHSRRNAIVTAHKRDTHAGLRRFVHQRAFPLRARPARRQRIAREENQRYIRPQRLPRLLG